MASTGTNPESKGNEASSSLHTPRPVPILAARLADEPRPAWLESLIRQGRLWVDRRGWHAGSGDERVDLDLDDYVILDEHGDLRTCHPLAFRAIFEPRADARTVTESEGEDDATRRQEWEEHRLRWLRASLPDDVELDGESLHALRPIPVLAAVVSREPHPGWVEKLMSDGRLWRDCRSYYIHAGGSRVTIGPDDYLVIDAEGKAEAYDRDTFSSLFSPYETARCEVARDDVFLEVAYHEGDVRFATGYVSDWGGLRWRLSADRNGEGTLTVFGRDVDEDDGPRDAWTLETSIDAGLAERALGTDGPCVRTESQRELAGIVAEALSSMDASVVRRSLLDELRATAPLPMGRRV